MATIIEKFFGSEKAANKLREFDENLRIAVDDIKKLEQDWHEKVKEVNGFLGGWNAKPENLKILKNHIRVIEEITINEQEEIKQEIKVNLKIAEITERLLVKIRNSDDPDKKEKLKVLIRINRLTSPDFLPQNFYQKLSLILNNQAKNWKQLIEVLKKQVHFINIYASEDIGVIHFNMHILIDCLKEEEKILLEILSSDERSIHKIKITQRNQKNTK